MYSKKPDMASLNQMARETNGFPLPHIPENPHILLPPPEHSLIRNNFQVFSEDLANMINNPNIDNEDKRKLEDLDLLSTHNRGKSRQSIIGIKRHTDRNTERLSITSNFKKRKTDLGESSNDNAINKTKNFNNLNSDYSNENNNNNNNINNASNINITNFNISSNANKKQANTNNTNNFKSAIGDNKAISGGNRIRVDSGNNLNEDEDNKSENQDFGENDYNNEEGDVEDYDQIENQSENSEGNFGLRDDFNQSDMGDYL